ncbi:Nn.00g092530.m01.CDS01 [Neocucurbitaria sp. VM-36]
MESRHTSPPGSPRPSTQRQRSNSVPIVEALGCSTPEAKLLLAEGRAAVRKRRAHSRRNKSVNDDNITTFDPRDHLDFLNRPAPTANAEEQRPAPTEVKSCHARIPSDATDASTSTVVPQPGDSETRSSTSPANPLGNYSANLAQFIKAQLRNIPTYTSGADPTSPLSPRSCPDLSFRGRTPPQSPTQVVRRPVEAPKVISIPPVRPPLQSQFSAWSSTDDDTDDDAPPLPDLGHYSRHSMSKGSNYTPSVLGYYETSNDHSFLFSSTPMEEDEEPDTAKGFTFPDPSMVPEITSEPQDNNDDYPSSDLSRPQLTSSSAPSFTSSASTSSYFDFKRPISLTAQLKDRIIAAVTPPIVQGKMLTAVSPWEGAALTNVHDVFVESQHRVHVDGMSFDMQRNFVMPNQIGTPC